VAFGVPNRILRDTGTELFKTYKTGTNGDAYHTLQFRFIAAVSSPRTSFHTACDVREGVPVRCDVTEGRKRTHTAYSQMLLRGVQEQAPRIPGI
jgi:hypothetical protein